MILIQIGINDSWHYKSLKGIPNVSKESFKANLDEIYFKCKTLKSKDRIHITGYQEPKQEQNTAIEPKNYE